MNHDGDEKGVLYYILQERNMCLKIAWKDRQKDIRVCMYSTISHRPQNPHESAHNGTTHTDADGLLFHISGPPHSNV